MERKKYFVQYLIIVMIFNMNILAFELFRTQVI
jgi:hypothetical protein